ncbi:MAG: phage major capsid protein, partial [Caldisericia bacterium]|nr:phage major capsid protein [Caldisericia bacterium]
FITERQLPIFFDYIENNSIVRPRSFNIPVDSSMPNAKVTMPKLKQDATGAFVEADFYPVGEGRAFTTTDAKIALATLEPKKHGCLVDMPNETLENTNAAEALINRMLKRAAVKYENTQFTSGAGGMFPIGFQNTEAMYTVKRNTANQVKYEDILAMLKVSMLDEKNNYIWMGSQSAFNYIYPMRDDSTYGEKVYRDGKLDGIPFIWTPTASALGTTNDLMLVNLQYYLTYIGTSLRLAQSKEYKFNRDMTVIRAKYSLDGDSWLSKYITRDDSTIVSPFIGLSSEVA